MGISSLAVLLQWQQACQRRTFEDGSVLSVNPFRQV
ncbi:hypothetical protein EVA_14015 [gut metagenome]|uniref:Uncharacterized protein n=1 Tax=gut metagenome TaxID=749906 RepID=J9FTQ1_9ZZZZ